MKPHQSQEKIHNIYVQKCLNNKNKVPWEFDHWLAETAKFVTANFVKFSTDLN